MFFTPLWSVVSCLIAVGSSYMASTDMSWPVKLPAVLILTLVKIVPACKVYYSCFTVMRSLTSRCRATRRRNAAHYPASERRYDACSSGDQTNRNFALGIQYFVMIFCGLLSIDDWGQTLISNTVIAIANIIMIHIAPVCSSRVRAWA